MRRPARQAALSLSRWFERGARACLHLAAGLSRTADMRDDGAAYWQDFLLGERDVAAGWMRWEESAAAQLDLGPGRRVLVVGCGTGRDLLPFLTLGCVCTGIDPAPGVVALAQRAVAARGLRADLVPGYFEDWQPPPGTRFDVIWFSWFSYSYICGREQRVAVLTKARGLLAPQGRIVVSLITNPGRNRLWRLGHRVARLVASDWRHAPGDALRLQVGDMRLLYEHRFAPGEAEAEFASAGLKVGNCWDPPAVFLLNAP